MSLRRNVTESMAPFDADAKSDSLGDNHTNVGSDLSTKHLAM